MFMVADVSPLARAGDTKLGQAALRFSQLLVRRPQLGRAASDVYIDMGRMSEIAGTAMRRMSTMKSLTKKRQMPEKI